MNYLIPGVSLVIAIISLGISYYIYKLNSKDTNYLDIDNQFSELLKLSLDEPDMRNYKVTSCYHKLDEDDRFKKKYNIYAYMCWNLVETIYDQQKEKGSEFRLSDTWVPVMIEENRLHYSWFKHNVRLFKKEFQNFITEEFNGIEIVEGDIENLKTMYETFERDFPQNERKSLEHLELLMLKGKYKLLLANHKVFDEVVGYALVYTPDGFNVLWLDYMAIEDKYQNSGYGTLLFNSVIEYKGKDLLGMFFEVDFEKEEDINTQKRLTFYKRLNCNILDLNYKFPTQEGGYPMHLMYKSLNNENIMPSKLVKNIVTSAFDYLHSDVSKSDMILKDIIPTISDQIITM